MNLNPSKRRYIKKNVKTKISAQTIDSSIRMRLSIPEYKVDFAIEKISEIIYHSKLAIAINIDKIYESLNSADSLPIFNLSHYVFML